MKTVGIITIYGLKNFGNRLQNYALNEILKNMGFNTITYVLKSNVYYQKTTAKVRNRMVVHKITGYGFCDNSDEWKYELKKYFKFKKFTEKNIPTGFIDDLWELSGKADFFVTGSDQVWNPLWYAPEEEDFYLLSFAKSKQKVCISPSFGIKELPKKWREKFRNELLSFPRLSVREASGVELIENLTGRTAELLIDPTLILNAEDWLNISKRYKKVKDNEYILTCFLGDANQKIQNDIELIKQKTGIRNVYQLNNKADFDLYKADPSEFIDLISRASIVLTDSFHACVFSFIFNKPFKVYRREGNANNIYSRIETLLSTFEIHPKNPEEESGNELLKCDYANGKRILEKEKGKFISYLRASLLADTE